MPVKHIPTIMGIGVTAAAVERLLPSKKGRRGIKEPKYPNRIYSTKASAVRAAKRYGGRGVKKVEIARRGGSKLKGWAIKW